jgi:peroxiredoxin Q/BCP
MSPSFVDFSLPNLGAGPDPFSVDALPEEVRFVLLCFQRDYHCTNCRKQVQQLAEQYPAFQERGAEVVSIVPEPPERVAEWQADYDLPFPLLADPDAEVGDAYDQPVRFGFLGDWSDFLGRMPAIVVLDRRGEPPTVAAVHRGRSTFDRPTVDELLAELDELLAELDELLAELDDLGEHREN